MNKILLFLYFQAWLLFTTASFAGTVDINDTKPPKAEYSQQKDIPDPCDYILASKIARSIVTKNKIGKRQSQLDRVRRVPVVRSGGNPSNHGCALEEDLPESFPDRQSRRDYESCLRQYIDRLFTRLSRIEADDLNEILIPFSPPLKAGEIGRMTGPGTEYQHLIISDIVDANNCIVDFRFEGRQIIKVWLRGLSTVNLADGSAIEPPPFMRITGTQDYLTPSGKNTFFVLEPLKF
jgi:hypothetical protein